MPACFATEVWQTFSGGVNSPLLRTMSENILNKLSNWYFSKRTLPYWCVLLLDCAIVYFAGIVVRYIHVGGGELAATFWATSLGIVVMLVPYLLCFRLFRTYSGIIRYSSFLDLERIALANTIAALVAYGCTYLLDVLEVSHPTFILQDFFPQFGIWGISTLLMWVMRVLVKTFYDMFRMDATTSRAFIYGIKDGGVSLAKNIRSQSPLKYDLRGFVAPEGSENVPDILMGVRVFKDDDDLLDLMLSKSIKVLLVSPRQSEHFREREGLADKLIRNGIHVMMMPYDAEEWDGKSDLKHEQLHDVDVEDLLPREKIEVDLEAIGALLKEQVVMITGAAGSIGSEMVRQVAKFRPKHLVLVDQAETPMHSVRLHMANHYAYIPCETVVSSITNQTKMEKLFAQYRPNYVFHAAAYKHVPMMEDNPSEAVQNNIYGTRVIADLAVKYGTKKFVMISTDKAVNPTNVMGCSKRICEIYCQALNKKLWEETQRTGKPTTQFITTRFGNVLGSNGSVIPLFRKQLEQGGPLTVTHPDIIRFFMLIPEACRLVLQAGTMGKGGEIYVFDMGKPVRIADLAQRMIDLSGAKNVKIQFTGLRDGEKLYEEVLNDAEQTKPTTHPKIMVAAVREYDYEQALKNEEELLELSYSYDDMAIVKKMKEIVPEYKSQHSKYEALDK